jgi:ubiquinone/menaquinone biosynthesis C-methylase UbiE
MSYVRDYTAITELPGAGLTPEQYSRFVQRYALAATHAQGRRVLEVACGAGSGLAYLAERAASVMGLDYTGPVLQQVRAHLPTLPLVQGDAQCLPFAPARFDLVVCFEAIYYLRHPHAFLAESRRVLAVGGLLLICQTNPDWPGFVPGALSVHYPSGPELVHALDAAGFAYTQLVGGLPVAETTPRQRVIQRVRRGVLQSGLLPLLRPLAAPLLRLAYGPPIRLPALLDAATAAAGSALPLTPLPSDRPDRAHQVLYALAGA